MKFNRGGILVALAIIGGVLIVAVVAVWLWLMATRNPLDHFLGDSVAWPVACSPRGCVTTKDWQQNLQARVMFSKALAQAPPTEVEALTTAIRHHLVKHAFLSTSVNLEDAKRYRVEILQLEDEKLVAETAGLTLKEYDAVVLMPLLRQEALRMQYQVETFDELFKLLANERKVVVLPFHLTWNKEEAKVEARSQ